MLIYPIIFFLCLSSKYQSLNKKREEGGYLSDFFLHWGWDGTVLSALCITLTVAALRVGAGDAGPARVTEFLLLISGLVLMFIVKHCFKVHHCPGMPGLPRGENTSQTPFCNWHFLIVRYNPTFLCLQTTAVSNILQTAECFDFSNCLLFELSYYLK